MTIAPPEVRDRGAASAGGAVEVGESFDCFGGRCAVHVGGRGAEQAVAAARFTLLAWHDRFSRFLPDSELSHLNADPREVVPVSTLMARLVAAVVRAAEQTGGLVDATLVSEIERAGYVADAPPPLALADALALAPARWPAAPDPQARWRSLSVERSGDRAADPDAVARSLTADRHGGHGAHSFVRRAPGVRVDSGGLAKGLFADVLASALVGRPSYAIVCGGDLRVGGASRAVEIESPFDGRVLHRFELANAGVATSGIGRRSWRGRDGRPAHHLLDPATGAPAFTGVVQATAIAPTALVAEVRAKAALLSGPASGARWLPDGGALVLDDGSLRLVAPPA